MTRPFRFCLTIRALALLIVFVSGFGTRLASQVEPTDDPRWNEAMQAYAAGHDDEGHSLLVALTEEKPGDLSLAVACYRTILSEEGRIGTTNPWIELASARLLSLERLGAISANTDTVREAARTSIEVALSEGKNLEVRETVDRFQTGNPHDLHWKVTQAQAYRQMDLAEARPLYLSLKDEYDPEHPDALARQQWNSISKELDSIDSLAKPIFPIPEGSPLMIMEPDDPDGHWRTALDRSPADIPEEIDRLAAHAFSSGQIVPWQDMSGLTDPPRALDLHLRSKLAPELRALRKAQDENFSHEALPSDPTEADILALSRRFPWSQQVQEKLLAVGNEALWDGRTESALRSFDEVLGHALDSGLKDAAQVGYWTALKLSGGIEELRETAGHIDPGKDYPWMGKTAKGSEIRASLLKGIKPTAPPPATFPPMGQIPCHILHLPPVSPWPTDTPAMGFGLDLQATETQIIASGRNLLVSYDLNQPAEPRWTQLHRHPVEQHRKTGYRPGYFRPLIRDGALYTRWGLTSLPNGIAAFDLDSGEPLWSHLYTRGTSRFSRGVPTGDPTAADGMLFYLQWNTPGDVTDRNRTISLVCLDPRSQMPRWTAEVATAGQTTDLIGSLEGATPQNAIYGNSVSVHKGAVYCNSNAGLIARCDVRDGRVDWIHYYRRTGSNSAAGNLGCAPLVAGDQIICMPRDAGRIFALDQKTGRLVWDNPMVLATEALGIHEDTLIVRGVGVIAGLDVKTGNARWFRPLSDRILGRSQLVGDSIFLGKVNELRRLDAKTGKLIERRAWDLGEARPLGFALANDAIYVISDRPASDRRQRVGEPLASIDSAPAPLSLPLKRTWAITRSDARIALAPAESGLRDSAFLLSGGIVECLDLSPGGSIKWRRFVDAHNATLSFFDDKLLLVEHSHSNHTSGRAVALSGRDGKFLWEAPVPAKLGSPFFFGSRLMYHDRKGQMVVLDLASGKQAWERKLSEAHLVDPYWDGQKLHIFHASQWHGPHHLVLDPDTGRTLQRQAILVSQAGPNPSNAELIENGWYEVRFPPTPAQFVRLTTLSDIGRRGWASAAELQVLDADGKRIPRHNWVVEAEHERNAAPRALPGNIIDGDPDSWWHSQWIGAIPPHPHQVMLDLGRQETISGFQYLPAKIINNNGMLRDYEWHVRKDKEDWGEPTAKGILVNRLQVDRALLGPRALFFEARSYTTNEQSVYRYGFGGAPAVLIEKQARLLSMHDNHALISVRDQAQNKEVLVLRRSDDANYRFDLSPRIEHGRHGEIIIEGNRLIMGRNKIVIADLQEQRFVDVVEDEKSPRNRPGNFVRLGNDHFLKIVHDNNKQALTMINMSTGQLTESTLETQIEQFTEDRFLKQSGQRLLTFDRTLLFYDNSTLSAWVAAR